MGYEYEREVVFPNVTEGGDGFQNVREGLNKVELFSIVILHALISRNGLEQGQASNAIFYAEKLCGALDQKLNPR